MIIVYLNMLPYYYLRGYIISKSMRYHSVSIENTYCCRFPSIVSLIHSEYIITLEFHL